MGSLSARYALPAPTDDELIQRHRGMIDRIARQIARRTGNACTADELWSAGAMGLLDAARRFDSTRAVKFETFAEHRIRGAILDELRKRDHLPRRMRTAAEKVSAARTSLRESLDRDPTVEELAAKAEVPVDQLAELEAVAAPPVPLDEGLAMPSREPSALDSAERSQSRQHLSQAISRLPERLQILLSLHYVEELSYREIAQVLSVSEPRVCQLHSDAVRALREQLSELDAGIRHSEPDPEELSPASRYPA